MSNKTKRVPGSSYNDISFSLVKSTRLHCAMTRGASSNFCCRSMYVGTLSADFQALKYSLSSSLYVAKQHDDVIKWIHLPRYWLFVRGIHWSPVNSPHKGQWRRALMFCLNCAWINRWVNNREAGDLRRHRSHYDVTAMNPWYHQCASRHYRHDILLRTLGFCVVLSKPYKVVIEYFMPIFRGPTTKQDNSFGKLELSRILNRKKILKIQGPKWFPA